MIERKQHPSKFRDYRKYKPYLRIDFEYRCAYCGITEYRWGSERNFVVEHFRPRSRFPDLATVYSNLYYACNRCNDLKGDTWPSPLEIELGYMWPDPCACEVYREHLRELDNGMLEPITPAGIYTTENLMLNLRPYLVSWRRERRQLVDDIDASLRIVSRLEGEGGAGLGAVNQKQLAVLIATHRRLCERLRLEY